MVNLKLSSIRTTDKSLSEVASDLRESGWNQTDSLSFPTKVLYFENNGVNITVTSVGPKTVITPSGPLRGMLFGSEVAGISFEDDEPDDFG